MADMPINSKTRGNKRQLILQAVDQAKVKSSTGKFDPRLFNGDNKLWAVMDPQNCLWELKYEKGVMTSSLKEKYTSFDKAFKAAENYFARRGIGIVGVED